METKHTAGPWAVNLSADKRERGYIRPLNGQMVGAIRCPAIAQVFSSYTTLEEATANAHLLASAPELLDALLRVRTLAAYLHGAPPHTGTIDKIGEIVQAAIAKAKGE